MNDTDCEGYDVATIRARLKTLPDSSLAGEYAGLLEQLADMTRYGRLDEGGETYYDPDSCRCARLIRRVLDIVADERAARHGGH